MWNGALKAFGYGAKTSPETYWAEFEVTSARSVEPAAVRYVVSPWYWPRKPRIIGRPVASRASFTAPSTTSVPVIPVATRVMLGGASSTRRSASSIGGWSGRSR